MIDHCYASTQCTDYELYIKSTEIFKNSQSHLKFRGVRSVTYSTLQDGPLKKVFGAQLKNVVARITWSLEFLHRARYIPVLSVHSVNGVHGVHSLHTRSVQTSFTISIKCRAILRHAMHIILLYLPISSPFSKTYVTPFKEFQVSIDPVQPATIKHNTALLEHRIA